jgi:hypothetical protein
MNLESERTALQRLKERVDGIRKDADLVWLQLRQIEDRVERLESSQAQKSSPPPLPVPAQLTAFSSGTRAQPIVDEVARQQPQTASEPADSVLSAELTPPTRTVVAQQPDPATPDPEGSLEMRVGTYWLVRIGVVMLLTAMVFFGKLAYQNFIVQLGPLGKVVLLYVAGGGLIGVGAWLERWRESMRQYGQVLFAGGLAAVYFTTYAAHHLEVLRVIQSPLVDGVLLLGWTAVMVGLADRRKSEILAVVAIGLAFYASAITRVGWFTLYSNLLLTVAAVVFLVRNRWTVLSTASLAAAYAGYAFWRFHAGGEWSWAGPELGFWSGAGFLVCYWLVFTAAVFLSQGTAMSPRHRVGFLTANNLGFFLLFLLTMFDARVDGHWRFCLAYGGVLLSAAVLAQRMIPDERWTGVSYLLQGLTLVTVGLIARFSGPQLGLILAAESVILLTAAHALAHATLRASAMVVGLLSALFTIAGLVAGSDSNLALGAGAGALLAFNAWWTGSRDLEAEERPALQAMPVWFAILALGIGLVTVLDQAQHPWQFPILAAGAVVLALSLHVLRAPELAVVGQGYLVVAQLGWLSRVLDPAVADPAWSGLVVLGASLSLTHWWSHQRLLRWSRDITRTFEGLYALGTVVVLWMWMEPMFEPAPWLVVSGLMALAVTGYGLVTRSALLAITGQLFTVVAMLQFVRHLGWAESSMLFAIVPIAAVAVLSQGTRLWLRARAEAAEGSGSVDQGVGTVAGIYGWAAVAMAIAWVHQYVPAREHSWLFVSTGAVAWAWGAWRHSSQTWIASGVFTVIGVFWFWVELDGHITLYLPNLAAVVLPALQQQAARRYPDRFASLDGGWHTPLMISAALNLGWLVTLWVDRQPGGFYLTAAWAALAFGLFVAGLLWRERVYRWSGLVLLALAMGRVALVDVWKLETVYRMLSFLALGIVLLGLGFIYNRYQERIRQWL